MLLLWGKDSEYPQHHISDEAWLMQMDAESVTWKKVLLLEFAHGSNNTVNIKTIVDP